MDISTALKIVGDVKNLLELDRQHPNRIFGGSACVFAQETLRLAQAAKNKKDTFVSALASGPFDLFSYGIHTVELLQRIAGYDAQSVTCFSGAPLGNYLVHFASGVDAHLHMHKPYQSWFAMVATRYTSYKNRNDGIINKIKYRLAHIS